MPGDIALPVQREFRRARGAGGREDGPRKFGIGAAGDGLRLEQAAMREAGDALMQQGEKRNDVYRARTAVQKFLEELWEDDDDEE